LLSISSTSSESDISFISAAASFASVEVTGDDGTVDSGCVVPARESVAESFAVADILSDVCEGKKE
jgi:hypothetical protein